MWPSLLFFSSFVSPPQRWHPDNSAVVAPSSTCPSQMSVCFNCLHDRMALTEVTARQLGHTATGVFQTRWSMSYLSQSQTTSMSYSSLTLTQTRWQTRTESVLSVSLWKWNMDVRGKFHRQTLINASFMFMYTLWCLCQGDALGWYHSIASPPYLIDTLVPNRDIFISVT